MYLSAKLSVIFVKLIGSLKMRRGSRLIFLEKATRTHKYQLMENLKDKNSLSVYLSLSFLFFVYVSRFTLRDYKQLTCSKMEPVTSTPTFFFFFSFVNSHPTCTSDTNLYILNELKC